MADKRPNDHHGHLFAIDQISGGGGVVLLVMVPEYNQKRTTSTHIERKRECHRDRGNKQASQALGLIWAMMNSWRLGERSKSSSILGPPFGTNNSVESEAI